MEEIKNEVETRITKIRVNQNELFFTFEDLSSNLTKVEEVCQLQIARTNNQLDEKISQNSQNLAQAMSTVSQKMNSMESGINDRLAKFEKMESLHVVGGVNLTHITQSVQFITRRLKEEQADLDTLRQETLAQY